MSSWRTANTRRRHQRTQRVWVSWVGRKYGQPMKTCSQAKRDGRWIRHTPKLVGATYGEVPYE